MAQPIRQLSLITPSGPLTLGNLLGALLPMRAATQHNECFYGISDLHALTVPRDRDQLAAARSQAAALLVACGLDEATLFMQSRVPAHTDLMYLLESTASMGELRRMIQFKEKGRGRPDTRVSLFTYPALMAADILLYDTREVPVGDDQRQHVELARTLAQRFNQRYGDVFTVPEAVTPPLAARVMDLAEPTLKMSKSHVSRAGIIYLLDDPDVVRRKVARAVTDSYDRVAYDPEQQPGVANLISIAAACTGQSAATIADEHPTYGALKATVADAILTQLRPIQKAYADLDPADVNAIFERGSQRAADAAAPVLDAARRAIGL